MTTITVWLLVMTGPVHSGSLGAVQPFMFPTAQDCQQVAQNVPKWSHYNPQWRCIQTTVVKP